MLFFLEKNNNIIRRKIDEKRMNIKITFRYVSSINKKYDPFSLSKTSQRGIYNIYIN